MKPLSTLLLTVSLAFTHKSLQAQSELQFSPQQLVIMVPDVDTSAQWYVENLDFKMGKPFKVPEKGLNGRLISKGDFEIMFMKSGNMKPLPEYRKTSFEDLAVAGVKRIAFKVDNLKEFGESLKERGVDFDVPVILFHDPDSDVKFYWCIIKDYDGNLIEFMEIF